MVTIKEIAKECSVSIATVSNILNNKPNVGEETKQKVLKAIEEMNYTPNTIAKNLKTKNTRTIGALIEDITVFCAPEIIDGITYYCEQKKYNVLLINLRLHKKFGYNYLEEESFFNVVRQEIRELISKQVEGIIYVTAHERELKCLPDNLKIPAVMAYGYTGSQKFPSVVVNDVQGAYTIVNYMIEQGHKKIGVITGKERSLHTRDRLFGYQKALYDNKIFYNPEFIVTGDWSKQSGYHAAERMIKQGVTAIFCMNDKMAGGVYEWLEENGKVVGQDISIAGYDNQEVAEFMTPSLTTIALPLHKIGETACRILIDKIENHSKEDIWKQMENTMIIEKEGKLRIRNSIKTIQ